MIASWGAVRGLDNDVGRIRSILMHRPGPEMNVVDPAHRLPEIGSYGDPAVGWSFQSDSLPDLPQMQQQHDAFVTKLQADAVDIHHLDGDVGIRLKQVYTRDPL